MKRGGARTGAGRPRKPREAHVLTGTFRDDRQAKPAPKGTAERLAILEHEFHVTVGIVEKLDAVIEDPTQTTGLGVYLAERRRQVSCLVLLASHIGALAREIRDTPKPPEPDAFDRWQGEFTGERRIAPHVQRAALRGEGETPA
jgi:hypothetical protein